MMGMAQRWILSVVLILPFAANAEISNKEVRIGLMTDMSNVYKEVGLGAEIAAELAIEDIGGKINGKKIRLFTRDHKLDTETGMKHAKELYENENVDLFIEMVGTHVAIPIQHYARENGILAIFTGTASSELTGKECSPTSVHWAYDTYALAGGTAAAIIEQGRKSWYFITADYAFGRTLEAEATAVIKRNGGTVLGSSYHPLNVSDFSDHLAEAEKSGAEVIALANAGYDVTRAIRQAHQRGLGRNGKQIVTGLLMVETGVLDMRQVAPQGLQLTSAFYWDYDDLTRAWSERFRARSGINPTMFNASVYSALMHYFKAIEVTDSDDAKTVIAKMRETPVNDFFARNGKIRADGRMVHDMFLLEVKRPLEAKSSYDYYKIRQIIPGDKAFRPIEEGGCPYLAQR